MKYLVYSYEHTAWWRANHRGYTRDIAQAGEYDHDEAVRICETRGAPPENPSEVMIDAYLARTIVKLDRSMIRDSILSLRTKPEPDSVSA